MRLLSLLDKTTYSGFRDSVAVLLYKTGIRITTLGLLEEKHTDFSNQILVLTGDIMKSQKALKLAIRIPYFNLAPIEIEASPFGFTRIIIRIIIPITSINFWILDLLTIGLLVILCSQFSIYIN